MPNLSYRQLQREVIALDDKDRALFLTVLAEALHRFDAMVLAYCPGGGIAVGTPITEHPPHRSERAQFTHSAPTLGV